MQTSGTIEPKIQRLRHRAQRALEDGRPRQELLSILDRLVTAAPGGSEHSLFAHRQLAELRVEDHPWRAALHLRQLVGAGAADDGVYALLGLSHALLGNLRASVANYRQALQIAPRNPWYHHNVGHLLDVGLDQPRRAIDHLRTASRLEPEEDEVTASLAHALARVGELTEAKALAEAAVALAPRHAEHQRLLAWIERGAPEDERAALGDGGQVAAHGTPTGTPGVRRAEGEAVTRVFQERMTAAGFAEEQIARARSLWGDFAVDRELRMQKPDALAGAVELAFAWVHELSHVTQADVARRYGVTKSSLNSRYREILKALHLAPRDPRY